MGGGSLNKAAAKIVFFILIIFFVVSGELLSKEGSQAAFSSNTFELIAHRGFEDQFPENTLYSARQASYFGANVEFDIQFTSDGVMVVMHDHTVDRTTTGHGAVEQLKYEYISSLDAGIKFSKDYKGLKVPTFAEYLDTLKDAKKIYPELKDFRKDEDIKEFTEILINKGFKEKATILTFDYYNVLPQIRKISKEIKVGALIKNQTAFDNYMDLAVQDGNSMYMIPAKIATPENLEICRRHKIDVAVWTIKDQNQLNWLRKIGYNRFICSRYMQ